MFVCLFFLLVGQAELISRDCIKNFVVWTNHNIKLHIKLPHTETNKKRECFYHQWIMMLNIPPWWERSKLSRVMKLNVDKEMWKLWQQECVERLANWGELNTVVWFFGMGHFLKDQIGQDFFVCIEDSRQARLPLYFFPMC